MAMLAVAAVLGLLGFTFLWRLPRCPAEALAGPAGFLSIIIPARNEEHNLPVLLRSIIRQQCQPGEIVVVDDGSTDRTAAIAAEFGARVVASQPLPQGWGGKTWACQQGAEAAAGDLFLFVDADTWFEDGGLGRILQAHADGGGVISVGPYHVVRRLHEQFSAFFNLIMTAGIGAFTLLGRRLPPRGLFGQMLLVNRRAYFAAGGHAAVRNRNLENFTLAGRFREAGVPLRCLSGREVFSFRMYPNGLREVINGWTKGFAAGASQTHPVVLLLIIAWLTGLLLPVGQFASALAHGDAPRAAAWAGLYAAFAGQVHFQLRRHGSFHWATALLYPVPLVFYFAIFTRSLFRNRLKKAATWKGRTFDAN